MFDIFLGKRPKEIQATGIDANVFLFTLGIMMRSVRVDYLSLKVYELSFDLYIYEGFFRVIMVLTVSHKPRRFKAYPKKFT